MHRITFERELLLDDDAPDGGWRHDAVVPVVDGTRLCDIVGDRFPGLAVELVALPSRQWLGWPTHHEDGRVVLLDGRCTVAGCCGVMARIDIGDDAVRWHDFSARGRPPLPPGLDFTSDRQQYEAAIAAI